MNAPFAHTGECVREVDLRQPDEVGGGQTQSIYLVVPDPDAVFARAKAAGAQIVLELKDQDYGGRDFSCFDLEGHLWTIGSYDPWVSTS